MLERAKESTRNAVSTPISNMRDTLTINRLINPPPSAGLPAWQASLAKCSHWLLYGFMFALPLVGWSMLSAGGYPIVIFGSLHLPAFTLQNATAFAILRASHTTLAFLLFTVYLVHLRAALFHALIRRDGVLQSIV